MIPITQIIKALGKYTGRAILRKSGVFGVYGSFKRFVGKDLPKRQIVAKITKSVVKKNILRSLGSMNYFIDIFKSKGGIVYALKQFGWQRLTPMAIKKGYYLWQNSRNFYKKHNLVMKTEKELFWDMVGTRSKRSYIWKFKQIEKIMDSDIPKKYKNELLNDWFYFIPKSTSHNFDCDYYRWNPITGELWACVQSGNGKYYKYYKANGVQFWLIKKSLTTTRYGKMIYWKFYHTH